MSRPARRLLIASLSLLFCAPVFAQPDPSPPAATETASDLFPDTPAGRAARLWFDAVRSRHEPRIREMIETQFDPDFLALVPLSQHLEMHIRLANAPLNLPHSIASQSDNEITYHIRDGGVWGLLRISVNPEEPHKITMVAVRPSAGPPELQGRPKTMEALRDETVEFLSAMHDNGAFDGSLFVATVNAKDPGEGFAWVAPGASLDIPIDFALDAIKLAVPLSVAHKSWAASHPPADTLATAPIGSSLEERIYTEEYEIKQSGISGEELAAALDRARRQRHQQYRDLVDSIFQGDSPAQREYQQGLVHALIFEPLWMIQCEVPFAAEPRMNPADLMRFARGLLDPEFIHPELLRDVTTGVGDDLDRSPRIVRRKAMAGFEERLDANGIRSFSLMGADDSRRILVRCYPDASLALVIVAQDEKTLTLIDRRLFARLPGLEPPAHTDD
ncbi:MAG: hypothetical protein R3B57_01500 [Phycisphaerales bacterium]